MTTTINLPLETRAALCHDSFLKALGSPKERQKVEGNAELLLKIKKLTEDLEAERNRNAEKAQRDERLAKITIRVVDRRNEWYAKQPKARLPAVYVSSQQIITADVWQVPREE